MKWTRGAHASEWQSGEFRAGVWNERGEWRWEVTVGPHPIAVDSTDSRAAAEAAAHAALAAEVARLTAALEET
jgi:hypothetical protein